MFGNVVAQLLKLYITLSQKIFSLIGWQQWKIAFPTAKRVKRAIARKTAILCPRTSGNSLERDMQRPQGHLNPVLMRTALS